MRGFRLSTGQSGAIVPRWPVRGDAAAQYGLRLQRLFVVVLVLVLPIVVPVIVRRIADRGFVVVIVVAWTGRTQKAKRNRPPHRRAGRCDE